MPRTDRHRYQQQWQRLHAVARRRLVVHGLVAWTALAGAVFLLLIVLFGTTNPVRWVKLGLAVSGLTLVVVAAFAWLGPAWRTVRRRGELARTLDRVGKYDDTLAAIDEALRRPDRWPVDTPIRQALVERLFARGQQVLDQLELAALLPVARPWLTFLVLAVVLAGGAWLGWRAPDVAADGWREVRTVWRAPVRASSGLQLVAGPDHVVSGSDVSVSVNDLVGDPYELPICEVRAGTGLWRPVPARQVDLRGSDLVGDAPYQQWQATLRQVRADVVYRFRRGQRVSAEGHLEVWRRPLLTRLAATVRPPVYTGRVAESFARLPAYLEVPVGSRIELSGTASSDLASAAAIDQQDTTGLVVIADSLAGTLACDESQRFRLELTDQRGLVGRGELLHEVVAVPDRTPQARLHRPDDDGRLPLAAPLLLQARADDDYGLARVDLLLRRGSTDGSTWVADLPGGVGRDVDDEGWERTTLSTADGGISLTGARDIETSFGNFRLSVVEHRSATTAEVAIDLAAEMGSLSVVPGDVLELALEAHDNRQPGPPASGRSAILRLQVPSSLDLLAARDEVDANNQAELSEMRKHTESLGEDLERLRRELLKDPVPDWDRRQEIETAVDRQQNIQDELKRLADALGSDLERLAEQRLTSPEMMDRMEEISQLLADAQDESMPQLLAKLRESLGELAPKELDQAMEDLAREQRELLRRLDTAMNMLQDLAREQEMEGLTDLVAEMIARQQELAEESRQEQSSEADEQGDESAADEQAESSEGEQPPAGETADREEQARRQEALASELEDLAERLEEKLAEMQEASEEDGEQSAAESEMQEALAEALRQMEEQRTSETMKDAGESLQQEQSDQAAQQMQQALTDLASLYHVLLKSQSAMQMAMKTEQAGQMRDLAADLLALSARQEEVGLDLPASLRDIRADDLARRQHLILQGLVTVRDALGDVAEAAPQEILRMLSQIDELITGQDDVLEQMREGRARPARRAASASLAAMNKLVIGLLTQAQMTGEGGGSGQSQPTLSQQLSQMSEGQSGLNSLAEQMSRKQGRISQEFRAGMQRLQQGQQGLAGRARQLAEEQRAQGSEAGQRLLGDLDELAAEMERVGDDVAGGLITEETLRRQERILSRLLDMHNASRERDWARRRESRTARDLFVEQEGTRVPTDEALESEARRWRPVEEAPPAYRDLVRDYYREIQKLHQETGRDATGRRTTRPGGDS